MRGRKDCVWPIFSQHFFFAEKHWAQLSKNKEWFIFYCSLALSPTKLHSCTHVSASLSCARAARDANERAKRERERERSEVVVGRYAHHKFYFCRETDGQKTNCARKLLNLCDFFFLLFSAIILPPKQTMESFEQCIVYQSQDIFFVLFFRDFCPLNVVFISICVCVSGGISWMRFTDVKYFFILSFSLSLTFRCFLGYYNF